MSGMSFEIIITNAYPMIAKYHTWKCIYHDIQQANKCLL
jgi:hypothetical protein